MLELKRILELANLVPRISVNEDEEHRSVFPHSEDFNNGKLIAERTGLSVEAVTFIIQWTVWRSRKFYPSNHVISELRKFTPSSPVPGYRAISFDDIENEKSKKLRSYFKGDMESAIDFADIVMDERGYIEWWYDIPPNRILVDFSMICALFPEGIGDFIPKEIVIFGY